MTLPIRKRPKTTTGRIERTILQCGKGQVALKMSPVLYTKVQKNGIKLNSSTIFLQNMTPRVQSIGIIFEGWTG